MVAVVWLVVVSVAVVGGVWWLVERDFRRERREVLVSVERARAARRAIGRAAGE